MYGFEIGETVELFDNRGAGAEVGATAVVTGWEVWLGHDMICVKWDRNGKDLGQHDGAYYVYMFRRFRRQTEEPSEYYHALVDGLSAV